MPRNILFVTTDQQRYDSLGLQRRHGGPHAGRRPAGGRGHQLPAGLQPEHRLHAGALLDADRASTPRPTASWPTAIALPVDAPSVADHLRDAAPATAPRSSARPISSRASTPRVASRRTAGPAGATPATGGGSTTPSRPCTPLPRGEYPIAHYGRWLREQPPRAPAQLRRAPASRARRRHRGARDQAQPDPPRVVPHRLGGGPHRSSGSTPSATTSTGSAG